MARRVFFSFHYQADISRVNVIRNSGMIGGVEQCGFWDHSLWEQTKLHGVTAIKQLIENGLQGSSVTVVLNGTETASRRWVRYEMIRSFERGNGMISLNIHTIRGFNGQTSHAGSNPFRQLYYRLNTDDTIDIFVCESGQFVRYVDLPMIRPVFIPHSMRLFPKGTLDRFFNTYDCPEGKTPVTLGIWIERAARDMRR